MNKLEQAARQAFETWWEREGQEFLFGLNTTTDDDIKLVAEIAWKNGAYCAEQAEQEPGENNDWKKVSYIRETLNAEQAEQEPVAWKHDCAALCTNGVELWVDRCPHCGKPSASPQPVKQEPVAYLSPNGKALRPNEVTAGELSSGQFLAVYAHPVRTKDLTDDEIDALVDFACDSQMPMDMFARAVVAKFKEKNK